MFAKHILEGIKIHADFVENFYKNFEHVERKRFKMLSNPFNVIPALIHLIDVVELPFKN